MERATMSEILAYLIAADLNAVYKGPSSLLQKMVFNKGSTCLLGFLIYAQNQKNWLYAVMDALEPVDLLKLKAQLDLNIETILEWIYSTWVNISGIMHALDENPAVNREPTQLPGFLFPSQVKTLMLVETEVLILLIVPIVWLIFSAVMALTYPTQTLRVAAGTQNWSILHFVRADEFPGGPT